MNMFLRTFQNTLVYLSIAISLAGSFSALSQELGAALNQDLSWRTGGSSPWVTVTNVSHDGKDSATHGPLVAGAHTWIETTVTGPGAVSFWWRSLSDSQCDTFQFSIDGIAQTTIARESPWRQEGFRLSSGAHALRWTSSDGSGLDQQFVWLDEVNYRGDSGSPILLTQPQSQVIPLNSDVALQVIAAGEGVLNFQWQFNDVDIPSATGSTLIVSNLTKESLGNYRVNVSNRLGSSASSNAVLSASSENRIVAWGSPSQTEGARGLTGIRKIVGRWSGYSLALKNDGTIANWPSGVLDSEPPLSLSNVVDVADGIWHSVALKADGSMSAWGLPDYIWVPVHLSGVKAISAGFVHNLALMTNGTVVEWEHDSITIVPGLSNVVSIAAGGVHNMALRADGTVVSWGGFNVDGQTNTPAELSGVQAIAAGARFSMALTSNHVVFVWGNNDFGQTNVPKLENVISISAGSEHCLALQENGTIVAWGKNTSGQTNAPQYLEDVSAVYAGNEVSFALVEPPPPPKNDEFFNRIRLEGTNLTVRGTLKGATHTIGEPSPAQGGLPSVWWTWTAPTSGGLRISALGSNLRVFVYTGTCLEALTLLSTGSLTVSAGEQYQIAVASTSASDDPSTLFVPSDFYLLLSLVATPANDSVANAFALSGTNLVLVGSNIGGTKEVNEPLTLGQAGSSVWWSWTAPAKGRVLLPSTDRVLSVYAENLLNPVVFAERPAYFRTQPQTTYLIGVDSPRIKNGSTDEKEFELDFQFSESPANDDFNDRISIHGATVDVTGTTVGATLEANEPGNVFGSVWWSWVAPTNGTVGLFSAGSNVIVVANVYTGTSLTNLQMVGATTARIPATSFNVQAGQEYFIQVSGAVEDFVATKDGTFAMKLVFYDSPLNSDQSRSILLTGQSVVVNEHFAGDALWYFWIAPTNPIVTTVTLESAGASLEIFKGDLTNLAPVTGQIGDNDSAHYREIRLLSVLPGEIFYFKITPPPDEFQRNFQLRIFTPSLSLSLHGIISVNEDVPFPKFGGTTFAASAEVRNFTSTATQPLRVRLVAYPNRQAEHIRCSGIASEVLPEPQEIGISDFFPTSLDPTESAEVLISGVSPAPIVPEGLGAGVQWRVFAILEQQFEGRWYIEDSQLLIEGISPDPCINSDPPIFWTVGLGGGAFAPILLTNILIVGPSVVYDGSAAFYSGLAEFSDNTQVSFTNAIWSASHFSISSNGIFQTDKIEQSLPVTLTVVYPHNGSHTNSIAITVLKQSLRLLADENYRGRIGLFLQGTPNTSCRIERSFKLPQDHDWTTVSTITLDASGTASFVDEGAFNSSRILFYRAAELP